MRMIWAMFGLDTDLPILIERGGIVMIPLLIMSVVSLCLIIERIWFWVSLHGLGRIKHLAMLNQAFRKGNLKAVKKLVPANRSIYDQLSRQLIEHGATDAVAIEAVEAQRPRVDRFMTTLSTIITAAPLLGILGTVIGIIQSFNLLGGQQTLTDPQMVSVGIAEALITTAMGLIVALITLFPYMVFKGHVERSLGRMESLIAAAQQGVAATDSAKNQTTEPKTPINKILTAERASI